jgi:hypothetical protein
MIRSRLVLIAALLGLAATALAADNSGRIYGKITTADGDTYEGFIRWDKNEASWVDILNGTKQLNDKHADRSSQSSHRKTKRVQVLGMNVAEWDFEGGWPGQAESGIRFGHIKAIESRGDDEARVTLKSGETVDLSGGSTDIGSNMRELIIEDVNEGETELSWEDIEKVELMVPKPGDESAFGDRLYGTLTTRRGDTYTGFVAWDVDEVFASDLLEGESKDRNRKIKFDKIASIERYSSSGSTVRLKAGEELVMKGSNDVDESNNGIIISDPAFGQVTVDWDQFEKLEFQTPPAPPRYDQFDGGRLLKGTVTTEDGDTYTGTIRWDNDEEYTWEILDGEFRDLQFDIELGLVKTIERTTSRSCEVTVSDGRTFRLRGSNDVDSGNKGIFIDTGKGKEILVDWEDFTNVEFAK